MNSAYDCIVMGGGPAGSTTATLVAEAGYSTLLLERDKMPRFHVGESLMPDCYWTFKRLGLVQRMQKSHFVKKLSVQFVAGNGKESQPFFFKEHDPRECSETWQVERADFDKLLFDNAAEKGADCHDQTRVTRVLFEQDRAVGVELQQGDEPPRRVASRVVVDATGQQALLANHLGLKRDMPDLKKAAIWGYYRGARRDPGENAGATLILHTREKQSWFWFIPLGKDITSIGVVGDNAYLLKKRGKPEEVYEEELVNCPGLIDRLLQAELVSKFHVAKEFSYSTTRHAGPGWVLVGDAFGFIDPIYSSGVFLALKSGELAADAIIEGFAQGDTSGERLGKWTGDFKDGMRWIRKLISAYYTNEFSFGAFMRDFPQHRGNMTDLLIGRVFQPGAGKMFDDLDPQLELSRNGAARS